MKLFGKKPVIERIRQNPKTILKLYLQKKTELSEVVHAVKSAKLEFDSVDEAWMKRECGNAHSQGVMAVVEEYKYATLESVISDCCDNGAVPVFLDGVTDPQNLGSIIRSLACLGGFSIVIPEHGAVAVNETVLRVACGGENYIKIAVVPNIATAIEKIKRKGIWVYGASAEGDSDIKETGVKFPLAVVIGSEGKGIRPGVKKHIDAECPIPMDGAPLSYNVAVAAALFCYEIMRNRRG